MSLLSPRDTSEGLQHQADQTRPAGTQWGQGTQRGSGPSKRRPQLVPFKERCVRALCSPGASTAMARDTEGRGGHSPQSRSPHKPLQPCSLDTGSSFVSRRVGAVAPGRQCWRTAGQGSKPEPLPCPEALSFGAEGDAREAQVPVFLCMQGLVLCSPRSGPDPTWARGARWAAPVTLACP